MSEVKTCPKCGGKMERGDRLTQYSGSVKLQYFGEKEPLRCDGIIPFYCGKCGYLELYRAMKDKKKE